MIDIMGLMGYQYESCDIKPSLFVFDPVKSQIVSCCTAFLPESRAAGLKHSSACAHCYIVVNCSWFIPLTMLLLWNLAILLLLLLYL